MAIIKWEPLRDIERLFDMDFPFMTMPVAKVGNDLALDVYEEGGNIIAELSLPGVTPDNFDITVEGDHLRISGTREEIQENKDKNYYYKEIKRGSFERTLRLPMEVQADKCDAKYKDGILKVTIPKIEASQPKKIKVTAE